MNKTAIKNYAVWARVQLIESCKQRAFEYGITEDGENKVNLSTIGSHILNDEEIEQRNQLISQINQKGYSRVMEEVAYTWFNRFIALRFMEVNGYLPSKIRVMSDAEGSFKPEIIKEAMTIDIDGIDRNKVINFIEKQDNESLYKYLLIAQCNALNKGLPYMFEKISNWTELLFPANILRDDNVIGQMVTSIPEEDFLGIEIIGWMYQYYISEKHAEVIDPLYGKSIKKEDLPAATQIFTTDWVVEYLVDNSLGKLWAEHNPTSRIKEKLSYYIEATNKDGFVIPDELSINEVHIIDPCVGSGHFLVYAFDVLLEIYRECGWADRDAAKSIITNNLFGIDIDDRAAQLASFSLTMKARKYNRHILLESLPPHIVSMNDSSALTNDLIEFVANSNDRIKKDLMVLKDHFSNAKEIGSLMKVSSIDYKGIKDSISERRMLGHNDMMSLYYLQETEDVLLPIVNQAELLANKYDVVITNPPYMSKLSPELKLFLQEEYNDYKSDLFSAFIYRCMDLCKADAFMGLMTPISWMFNKSHYVLRREIIERHHIVSLIQMASGAFKEAGVDVCAFVISHNQRGGEGAYIRLDRFKGDMEVQNEAVINAKNNPQCDYFYHTTQDIFRMITGMPIAYWVSNNLLRAFSNGSKIGELAKPRQGMATCDNNRFLRLWPEIDYSKMFEDADSLEAAANCGKKWVPYNKGGTSRKWYGNYDYLVNWENDGEEIKANAHRLYGCVTRTIQNMPYYFKECFTWSLISTTSIGFRYRRVGSIFDKAGMSCFAEDNLFELLALCNSKIMRLFLEVFAPTINCQAGDIADVPVLPRVLNNTTIEEFTKENIKLSQDDWNAFELSWNFKKHMLV